VSRLSDTPQHLNLKFIDVNLREDDRFRTKNSWKKLLHTRVRRRLMRKQKDLQRS